MPSAPGRPEDALLAALDDAAAFLSDIRGCVRVIAGHVPSKPIRQELRRIIAALDAARDCLIEVRRLHHERTR